MKRPEPIRLAALLVLALCSAFSGQADKAQLSWTSLEGGCFTMGEARAYREESPPHEACVAAFDITVTEITNTQFAAFVAETGYVTRAERGWIAGEAGGPGVELPPASAVFSPPKSASPRDLSWWRLVEGANWKALTGPGSARPIPDSPVVHVTRQGC